MRIVDLVRIECAISRYDFCLELRGTRGRDRRAMRRELRDNVNAAATDVGTTRALFGIGSPKELAHAATPRSASRPRWSMACSGLWLRSGWSESGWCRPQSSSQRASTHPGDRHRCHERDLPLVRDDLPCPR